MEINAVIVNVSYIFVTYLTFSDLRHGQDKAEYQKAYRERKKKTDKTYLEKERRRAKSNRVTIGALNKRKQEVIRERNRQYVRKFRAKIKSQNELNEQSNGQEVQPEPSTSRASEDQPQQLPTVSSSTCTDSINQMKPTLVVKMNFGQKKKQLLKRLKALRSASYKINNLKLELKKVT